MFKKSLLFMLLMTLLAPWAVAQQSLDYFYGFETNLSVDGWTATDSSNSGIAADAAHSGSYGFMFSYEAYGNYLVSPLLTGTDNGINVSFYYAAYSASYYDHFYVGYTTDADETDPSEFTYGSLIQTSTTDWTEYTGTLPAGTVRFAIFYDDDNYNDGWYLFLDDFSFEAIYDCDKPTSLTVSNIETTQVLLGWFPGEGTFNVEYKTAEADTWTTYLSSYSGGGTYLDGLTPATSYDVRVQKICDKESLSGWKTASFTTSCPDSYDIPYSYGFESSGQMNCWKQIDTELSDGYFYSAGNSYAHTGNGCYYFSSYNGTTDPQYLVSPLLSNVEKGLHVEFWYRKGPNGTESFKAGYTTSDVDFDSFDPDDFVWDTEVTALTDTYQQYKANYPAGVKYFCVQYTGADSYYVFLDDFTFEEAASCLEPTGVTVSNETTTGATISWTAGGTETEWDIFVTDDSTVVPDAETTPTVASTDENPYNLTGLTAASTYYVYVRAICEGPSAWTSAVSFNTECYAMSLPYSYNFNTGSLTVCWNIIQSNTTYTGWDIPQLTTGDYAFRFFRGTSSADLALVLPEVDSNYPLNGYQISFNAAYYNGSSYTMTAGKLGVGIMTDPDDFTTFELIEEVNVTEAYSSSTFNTTTYTVMFNTYSGSGRYIAISDIHTANGYVIVDNIEVTELPACIAPTALGATPSTTSAVLNWTANSGETSWNIYYKKTSETDYIEVSNVKENPYTLTPLVANTNYEYYVVANCSPTEPSDPSAVYSFKTQCGAVTTFPWDEDFEGMTASTVPECWDNSASTAQEITSNPQYIWGVYEYSSNKMIRMYNYFVHTGTALINSPSIDLPSTGVYQLTFDYAHNASCGAFKVNISDDNGTTWVEKGSYTKGSGSSSSDPGTFTSVDPILLGDYAGQTIMIQFFANADYGSGAIFVDNVLINEAPNCIAPNGLSATPAATSAELSWTANSGETSWNIYYKKTSETDYTELKKVTDNPYTLPGLNPATDYEFYVVANCTATETSDPSSVYYFSTECEPFTVTATNKYTQDFESPVVTSTYSSTTDLHVPSCWENPYTTGSSAAGQPHLVAKGASYNYSTSQVLLFYGSGNNYVTLPEFTNNLQDLQISFKWATESSSNGTLTLGYITDGDVDYNTFAEITSYPASSSSYQTLIQADPVDLSTLPATAKRLAFRWVYSGQYSCNVDDLVVELIPTCKVPTGLTCTDYTATTATFDWTPSGTNQTAWQLYISDKNIAPANDIAESEVINVTTHPYTVTSGLVAEHTYYAWVRGNCEASSEGYSEWSEGIEFMPSQYKNFTYQEEATSSTGYVPFYGYYCSNATNKGQILIPASAFPADMADATIRRLTFYTTNGYPTADWGTAEFDVLVTEVDETSFATTAFFNWATMTTVYSGSLSVSGNQMVIDLDTPFSYTGGNLVIGFNLTTSGSSATVYWVATYGSTYLAAYQYGTNSVYRTYYQPMTTFNYLPNPTPRPINPHPTEELSTEATVAWTAPNSTEVTGYQYQYKLATSTEWPTYYYDEIGLSATMTELTPEKTYDFRVRAVYPGPAYSQYAETQFTTTASCAIPDGLAAANLTQNTADLTWNASPEVANYTVEYRTAATVAALFKEDFEDEAKFAEWTFTSMNTANNIASGNAGRLGVAKYNGDYGFRFSSFSKKGDTETYDQYLVSPELTVTGQLKFYAKRTNSSVDQLYAGYSTTTAELDQFTWSTDYAPTQTWDSYTLDLPADVKYIAFHYFGNYTYYVYIDDITIGEHDVPVGTWTEATDIAPNTGAYTIGGLTAGTKYDVRVYANCAIDPETDNTSTTFTTLADNNIVFPETGVWNSANFEPAVDPTVADNVIIRANVTITDGNNAYANNVTLENGAVITIENGATLTIKGTVTGGGSNKIIIEDGGQLIHNNSVDATVKKNITAPAVWKGSSDSDGWYLIATPVYSTTISSTFTGVIDLFEYNEPAAYWYSYNNGDHTFSTMYRGTGYLHASQNNQTVSYAGSMISTESAETKSLSYTSTLGDDVRGFNLVGNPYTRNLVLGDMTIGSTPVSTVYVITDEDRTKLTAYTTDEYAVKPGEGFFVQATAASQTLTMNPAAKDAFDFRYIKIVAGNENGSDNAFVQFETGNTLRKMNIANKTSVYVIDNGDDYAAATINELAGSIPVHFQAVADGNYTITVNAKNLDVNTMLLFDNFTGETIDLLENPSYTFKATTNDEDNRFKLIFDCNNYTGIDENFTGDIFAYQYGNEIIVNGEGTLEVFDVMGRMVLNTKVNGVQKVNVPANNVYIFKLMGETVKTQKIVVR